MCFVGYLTLPLQPRRLTMAPGAVGCKRLLASTLNEDANDVRQPSDFARIKRCVTTMHQPISQLEQSLEAGNIHCFPPASSAEP